MMRRIEESQGIRESNKVATPVFETGEYPEAKNRKMKGKKLQTLIIMEGILEAK